MEQLRSRMDLLGWVQMNGLLNRGIGLVPVSDMAVS